MNSTERRRFSSAHVMSAAALFIALGGVAWAGVNIANKSIGAKKLKDNAANSRVIKDDAVRNQELADASVGTANLIDNAVTGAKADESTFGQVPSAATADTATNATNATNAENANEAAHAADADHADQADNSDRVNGVNIEGIRYRANAGGANSTVINEGGVTVTASCDAGGDVELVAESQVDQSIIQSYSIDLAASAIDNVVNDDDFDDTQTFDLVNADDNDQNVTMQFSKPTTGPIFFQNSSSAVTMNVQVDNNMANDFDCIVTGNFLRAGGTGGIIIIGP